MKIIQAALVALTLLTPAVAGAAERLVARPYPAERPWTLATDNHRGLMMLQEYIPADQQIESYRDILTVQAFPDRRDVSPAVFLRALFSDVTGACEKVTVNGPVERQEGDRPVAYAQIYCSRQIGRPFGVHMFFKVIQGEDALYVVQREFRVPPSAVAGQLAFDKKDQAKAVALLKGQDVASGYLSNSVYLCADRSTEARCRR
jgi:hypothetical protein